MSEVSRTKSAFWGTIASQIFTIVSMLIAIVSTPLMVKYLDKESYGLSIIFFQIVNYLALFDFGLSSAVIRSLAIHRGDDKESVDMINKIMSTSVFIGALFGVVIALAGSLFAFYVPSVYNLRPDLAEPAVPIVITLSVLVGFQFVQRGLGGIFYAHHRQVTTGVPQFVVTILSTILSIVLLSYGFGLWSFVYSNIFQIIGNLVTQIVLLRIYYPKIVIRYSFLDKKLINELMSYGFFLFLHGLALQVILNTDRLVVGQVLSLSLVSMFSITVRVPEVFMSLVGKVTDNALPAISEIISKEDESRFKFFFRSIMNLVVSMCFLGLWIMIIMNKSFIAVWVGSDFFAGQYVLILAVIIMIQQMVIKTIVFFLNAKGISKPISLGAFFEAGINIVLSVYLGKRLGLPGVLIGTLGASMLTSSWYTPYLLKKHLNVHYKEWFFLLRPAVSISIIGAMILSVFNIFHLLDNANWYRFITLGFAVSVIMGFYVWVFYLKSYFGSYIPNRFKRFFLV